jgi:hypothetical protein
LRLEQREETAFVTTAKGTGKVAREFETLLLVLAEAIGTG